MKTRKILLNFFHPNFKNSRGNRALLARAKDMPQVTFRDLCAEYPNFKIDIKKEQALLLAHDVIVFQHPFYWFSCPALMKEWMDRVLEQGFAFPPGVGDKLNGKSWLSVVTTGGPFESYRSGAFNNFTISELLRPFQQAANLCGMTWIAPCIVHSVLPAGISGYKNVSTEELAQYADEYQAKLLELSQDFGN